MLNGAKADGEGTGRRPTTSRPPSGIGYAPAVLFPILLLLAAVLNVAVAVVAALPGRAEVHQGIQLDGSALAEQNDEWPQLHTLAPGRGGT